MNYSWGSSREKYRFIQYGKRNAPGSSSTKPVHPSLTSQGSAFHRLCRLSLAGKGDRFHDESVPSLPNRFTERSFKISIRCEFFTGHSMRLVGQVRKFQRMSSIAFILSPGAISSPSNASAIADQRDDLPSRVSSYVLASAAFTASVE